MAASAGFAVLMVSLVLRSLDARLCTAFPQGTHFVWHLLNGVMLGWMIEVWRRHVAFAAPRPEIAQRRAP